MYKYHLLDADDTLYDFPAAERGALSAVLREIGRTATDRDTERFGAINARLWRLREAGGITQDELVVRRFEEFLGDRYEGVEAVAARYIEALSRQAPMLPGAMEVVQGLKARGARVAIVTNGVARTQRGRFALSGLDRHIDALVISEEAGFFKPDPRMITLALARLGCADPRQALMTGDNPRTDLLAAQRAGVDACWYNPNRMDLEAGYDLPTHTIHSLEELLSLAPPPGP